MLTVFFFLFELESRRQGFIFFFEGTKFVLELSSFFAPRFCMLFKLLLKFIFNSGYKAGLDLFILIFFSVASFLELIKSLSELLLCLLQVSLRLISLLFKEYKLILP